MDLSTRQPVYLQIMEQVCESILSGRLAANERIPSVREMAAQLDVNPNTIMRSYALLQQEAIIRKRPGIGFFVPHDGKIKAAGFLRGMFFSDALPRFFRTAALLGIRFTELQEIYHVHTVQSDPCMP